MDRFPKAPVAAKWKEVYLYVEDRVSKRFLSLGQSALERKAWESRGTHGQRLSQMPKVWMSLLMTSRSSQQRN